MAELADAHDLGAEPQVVLLDEGVVDIIGATWLPPSRGKHPLVQPVTGMTKMHLAV